MARLFRILLRIFVVLSVMVAVAVGLVYYLAGQSLPDYDRRLKVAGISGAVEIVRDNHAVPHVFAEAERDLYFGLGYAHAEDRLWQMLLMRRRAQGRLSEVFGERTLALDRFMRTVDIYTTARDSVEHQTPETRAVLESYAAGVNARLKAIHDLALGRGAPELFLFSPRIAPWTPADSLAILRQTALMLTDKAQTEILAAELRLRLPLERVNDIFPEDQGRPLLALPEFAMNAPGPEERPLRMAWTDPLPEVGLAGASNAWAVAPSRSASGGTLLANDPHLAFSAPAPWYLARLEFPEGGVIGATIPGLPVIASGRNSDFAWGVTASYLDDTDLYYEKLLPDQPEIYETPDGGVAAFERKDVIIEVKDGAAVTLSVRKSRHGPVLLPEMLGVGGITPPGHVVAMKWTGFDPTDRSLEAMLKLMRARSIEDARDAIALGGIPSLNVVMATKTRIALQASGRVPLRQAGNQSRGRFPVPGWNPENDWLGYAPYEDNPHVTDPPSGVVVNTNNRLTDEDFPDHWSFEWGDDQRILRAERMLNGREFHTLDSLIEIQTDTVSPAARTLLPLIARDLWYDGEPAAIGTVERRRQEALKLLANWNGEMSEHDPEPLIYAAWVRALQRRLIEDDLGPLTERMVRPNPLFIERVFRNVDGAAQWCDLMQTTRVEDCTETARVALDIALLELVESHGDRIESWRWGAAHQALHKHDVLGSIPVLRWFVNIRQDTSGGDSTLMRGLTPSAGRAPYQNVHGASFRAVYDLADPEASQYIISTGQSGHFLSRHYDDLAGIWRRPEYIRMTLDPVLARGGNVGITVLEPRAD